MRGTLMPAPTTHNELLELVRKSGLVEEKRLAGYLDKLRDAKPPADAARSAGLLVRDGILTQFQAEQLLLGKWRRFHIGKYKVLERIGSGGMGSVYLCEHRLMRRRVAVKVLPTTKAEDTSAKERFLREARAVAALDHPNIVRAYDVDQDDNLHFLVMEYVDGSNLQEIIKRRGGPLEPRRAAHYGAQASLALQHAHETAGIVHRDIKPGNVLVDRNGVVKVLDMGLARFFHDEEDLLTQKYDENVLGTADYLAPEQALDSHGVDIRADIYSLGATLYFCLAGKAPFSEGTVAQKLIWHQTRQPKPLRALRPDVPAALAAAIEKMMAKDPNQRYQEPAEVAAALAPWTREPIPPPPAAEMPRLSPAATGGGYSENSPTVLTPPQPSSGSGVRPRRVWQVADSPRPQPAPAPKPPSDEPPAQATAVAAAPDAAPWEDLLTDTQDAITPPDTVPHKSRPRRRSGTPVEGGSSVLERIRSQPAFLWAVAGGVAAACVLVFILWRIFLGSKPRSVTPTPSAGPQVLRVQRGRADQPGTFDTLRDALARAKDQDRIQVFDDLIEEQITLADARLAKGVSVESGLEGKSVVWRAPAQVKHGEPLLRISGVEGLSLQGFVLDGQGRVKELVAVSGLCPGLTLDNLRLHGFTAHAIALVNCEGLRGKPVRLSRLHIKRALPGETAVFFDALPKVRGGVNQHVVLRDIQVEGGEGPAVLATSPDILRNIELDRAPPPETNTPPPPPEEAPPAPQPEKPPQEKPPPEKPPETPPAAPEKPPPPEKPDQQ